MAHKVARWHTGGTKSAGQNTGTAPEICWVVPPRPPRPPVFDLYIFRGPPPPAGARPVAGCCNRPGSVASSQHHGGSMSDYLARLEVATCQPPLIPCQCRTIDSPAFDFRIRSPQPCLYRESRGDFSLQLYIVHRLWLSTHARQSDRTSSYMLLTPSNALSVCIAQPFHATNVELSVLHSMSRRVLVQPA